MHDATHYRLFSGRGWNEHNVHYHVDHHPYPSVPYYNLPRLHTLLLTQPEYVARAHVTNGYFRGLRLECVGPGAQA
jgi:fatty acid desaturase